MFQQIRQLLDLISKSVDNLEQACNESGTQIPNPHEPFHPSSEAFRDNLVAEEAACIISAAALQLDAIVSPPQNSLFSVVGGHLKSAAIRLCLESNVTEILREAGPNGLHVDDITAKNGVNTRKMARCLRILATGHIYREVKPDVFANTRISSLLDTLKSSNDIIADPEHKYDNTNGLAAYAGHYLDESFKSSPYLWETLETVTSNELTSNPFSKAVANGKTFGEWKAQAENAFARRRFDISMRGVQAMQKMTMVASAFDWKSLPDNALVVDVGGGIGAASMILAKDFPNLKIVIQDLPSVVQNGIQIWKREMPNALSSGQVKFEEHDFFAPQPRMDGSVFILRQILHGWSDEYCVRILKNLRDVATPDTRLVCMDKILPYACHDPNIDRTGDAPIVVAREAPAPLLANWGAVNEMVYLLDMAVMMVGSGYERTLSQFDWVFRSAGWKVTAVHCQPGVEVTTPSSIVAVPV